MHLLLSGSLQGIRRARKDPRTALLCGGGAAKPPRRTARSAATRAILFARAPIPASTPQHVFHTRLQPSHSARSALTLRDAKIRALARNQRFSTRHTSTHANRSTNASNGRGKRIFANTYSIAYFYLRQSNARLHGLTLIDSANGTIASAYDNDLRSYI